jgi:hypothetical protein
MRSSYGSSDSLGILSPNSIQALLNFWIKLYDAYNFLHEVLSSLLLPWLQVYVPSLVGNFTPHSRDPDVHLNIGKIRCNKAMWFDCYFTLKPGALFMVPSLTFTILPHCSHGPYGFYWLYINHSVSVTLGHEIVVKSSWWKLQPHNYNNRDSACSDYNIYSCGVVTYTSTYRDITFLFFLLIK